MFNCSCRYCWDSCCTKVSCENLRIINEAKKIEERKRHDAMREKEVKERWGKINQENYKKYLQKNNGITDFEKMANQNIRLKHE